MKTRIFQDEFWVDQPLDEVFEFFSKAENLEKITPPILRFKIISELPIEMGEGTLIDYKLKIRRVPVKWKTKITKWNPPIEFQDSQLKGPYRQWIHTHTFEEKDGGTIIRDKVEYVVPGWIFEPIIHSLFVKNDIQKIFKFRKEQFDKYFN